MAAAQMTTREEGFLRRKDYFRRNAFWIIQEMVCWNKGKPSVLVDEVLHSIFFLGEINNPCYGPNDIVSDAEMLNKLKGRYPRPFQHYSSQLPRRSPMSCVLDMIIMLTGQEEESTIIGSLQTLIRKLKMDEATDLISSTICVSQCSNTQKSVRYYGVSMSTSGRNPGRIMVAASCLSNWDSYAAGAVMTYYPVKEKKEYFDGTITLPEYVRCQAINLSAGREMLPCRSCANLFGFPKSGLKVWAYGNCAEVESVSNLFKEENEVKEEARPTCPTCTEANRNRAKDRVLEELKDTLIKVKFTWDGNFYTPQQ